MNLSIEKVQFTDRSQSVNTVSMEMPVGSKKKADLVGTTLQAMISDEKPQPAQRTEKAMMREHLTKMLQTTLTERECHVLRMRFGLDDGQMSTLQEIGKSISVTRERVRQIESRALQKMR